MTSHESWSLICRLFSGGTPVLRAALSPREINVLPAVGHAIKQAMLDRDFVLCPHCQQHRVQVWGDGHGSRMCRCPDCGPVAIDRDDGASMALDEDWLRRKLRTALEINSRDGIDDLGNGVWRLGNARSIPVLLARDPTRIWHEPALLDRVRVDGQVIRLITPRSQLHAPPGAGVEWLAIEERFALYGDTLSFIDPGSPATKAVTADPAIPVNGPFSADFRWVTLPNGNGSPIHCTEAQAKVFNALWSFNGQEVTADRIMQRAGLASDKPIDVFKVKTRDKGKPEYEQPLAAYRALVITQRRQGLYSLACAPTAMHASFTQ
ncbi:hypothetical protein LGM90_26520 [Burkholderia sp. AU28942]|uniref:hypothetical protein n=1 Tax=Burkholderia TaxID=32008 RepID=UPI0008422261|nr:MULTISPECIES: hypothetical protein [Burkholderia]AOK05707.1 hypothetical protein WK25_15265 [Burkholderia latens]MCA8312070.1 hypothetical protein [Burkholderia sp. AU28942]HDR9127235.1 hypothetical protein [Burkholderia vietnamiensis]